MYTQMMEGNTLATTRLREDHGYLLKQIIEYTDHRRWDAIEQLRDYGFQNDEISIACDKHDNFVNKWRYRNKGKYKNRPEKRKTVPIRNDELTMNKDGQLPDYGELPYTGHISNLDHYSWAKKYAPHLSQWDRLQYQEDIADKVWDNYQAMIQVGRDHGKTWIMIKLFARWVLEVGQVIVIATKAKYDEIYDSVLEILESDEVRKDYGDVITRSRRGEIFFVDELSPPVGAKFQIHKSESYITGLHFSEEGWIHYEDIVQEMKVGEAAERRVRWWYKRTARYIRSLDAKETATATRKDIEDLYGWWEKDFHWNVILMKSFVVESGRLPTVDEIEVDHQRRIVTDYPQDVGVYRTLDCPNFPIGRLLYDFIFHPEDAEAELNNNPLPSQGAYFDGDNWIEQSLPTEFFNTYIVVDPAFGGSSTSSKTAILVLGIYKGKLFIVDAYIGRADFDEKEEFIIDFFTQYNPLQTWVEDNFNQMSRSFSKHSRLANLKGLHLIQSTSDKKERIGALKFPYKKNEIIISNSCPFAQDLKAEYLRFNLDDTSTIIRSRYNGLDALSIGYLKLRSHLGRRTSQVSGSNAKTHSTRSNARRAY